MAVGSILRLKNLIALIIYFIVSFELHASDRKILRIELKGSDTHIVWSTPNDKDFYAPGWKEYDAKKGEWVNTPQIGFLDDLASIRTFYKKGERLSLFVTVSGDNLPNEIYMYTMLNTAGEKLVAIYNKIIKQAQKRDDFSQSLTEFIDAIGDFQYDPYRTRNVKPKEIDFSPDRDFKYAVNVFANPNLQNPRIADKIELEDPVFNSDIFSLVRLERVPNTKNTYQTTLTPEYPQSGSMLFLIEDKNSFKVIPLYYDIGYKEYINAFRFNFMPSEAKNMNVLWGINLYTDMADVVDNPEDASHFRMLDIDKLGEVQKDQIIQEDDLYKDTPLPVKTRDGKTKYIKQIKLGTNQAYEWLNDLRGKYPNADELYLLPVEKNSNQGGVPDLNTARVFKIVLADGNTRNELAYNVRVYIDDNGKEYPNKYTGFRYQYDNSSNTIDSDLGTDKQFAEFIEYAKKLFGRVMLDVHLTKVALTGYEIIASPEMEQVYDKLLYLAGFRRKTKRTDGIYLQTMTDKLVMIDKKTGKDITEGGIPKEVPAFYFFHPVHIGPNEPLDPITRPVNLSQVSAIPVEYREGEGKWGFTEFNVANKYVAAMRILILYDYYSKLEVDIRADAYQNIPLLYRDKMGIFIAMIKANYAQHGHSMIFMGETVLEDPRRRGFPGVDVAQVLSALQILRDPKNYQNQNAVNARYFWYRPNIIGEPKMPITVGLGHHDTSNPFEPYGVATDAIGRRTLTLGRNGQNADWRDFIAWQTFFALEPNTILMEPPYMRTGAIGTNNPKGEVYGKSRGEGYYMLNNDDNVDPEAKRYDRLFDRIILTKDFLCQNKYTEDTKTIPLLLKSGDAYNLIGVAYLDNRKKSITIVLENVADFGYNISFNWSDVIPVDYENEFFDILDYNRLKGYQFAEIFNLDTNIYNTDDGSMLVNTAPINANSLNCYMPGYGVLVFTTVNNDELKTIKQNVVRTIPELRKVELIQNGFILENMTPIENMTALAKKESLTLAEIIEAFRKIIDQGCY